MQKRMSDKALMNICRVYFQAARSHFDNETGLLELRTSDPFYKLLRPVNIGDTVVESMFRAGLPYLYVGGVLNKRSENLLFHLLRHMNDAQLFNVRDIVLRSFSPETKLHFYDWGLVSTDEMVPFILSLDCRQAGELLVNTSKSRNKRPLLTQSHVAGLEPEGLLLLYKQLCDAYLYLMHSNRQHKLADIKRFLASLDLLSVEDFLARMLPIMVAKAAGSPTRHEIEAVQEFLKLFHNKCLSINLSDFIHNTEPIFHGAADSLFKISLDTIMSSASHCVVCNIFIYVSQTSQMKAYIKHLIKLDETRTKDLAIMYLVGINSMNRFKFSIADFMRLLNLHFCK